MNPLLSIKTNPSCLSFNQLKPYCSRLYNILIDSDSNSQRERIRLEQQLWAEVKLLRNFKDQNLLNYLIGYYHSILYQDAKEPSIDDAFQYNILVRLGDLNRYRQSDEVAHYYYSNARNLFPLFGHAYNQLALILAKPEILPHNYYKCCYYYARAAKSSDKSLEANAESNLRIAARAYDGDILYKLLTEDGGLTQNGCVGADDSGGSEPRKSRKLFDDSPKIAVDWFYVMVVAICADNIQPTARLFLDFMRDNFSLQRSTMMIPSRNARQTSINCGKDSYLLLACLDIFLDWLKLGSQGAALLPTISVELRRMRTCLQSTLASIKYESSMPKDDSIVSESPQALSPIGVGGNKRLFGISEHTATNSSHDTINSSSPRNLTATSLSSSNASAATTTTTNSQMAALPHDYTLRGFKPLDQVHKSLTFCSHKKLVSMINQKALNQIEDDYTSNESFIDSDQLKQILVRITSKMDGFGGQLKKKSRNIALESILANMGNS